MKRGARRSGGGTPSRRGGTGRRKAHLSDLDVKLIVVFKRRRKELKLTQRKLSTMMGKAQPWVSKIENRQQRMSADDLVRLTHCLGGRDLNTPLDEAYGETWSLVLDRARQVDPGDGAAPRPGEERPAYPSPGPPIWEPPAGIDRPPSRPTAAPPEAEGGDDTPPAAKK